MLDLRGLDPDITNYLTEKLTYVRRVERQNHVPGCPHASLASPTVTNQTLLSTFTCFTGCAVMARSLLAMGDFATVLDIVALMDLPAGEMLSPTSTAICTAALDRATEECPRLAPLRDQVETHLARASRAYLDWVSAVDPSEELDVLASLVDFAHPDCDALVTALAGSGPVFGHRPPSHPRPMTLAELALREPALAQAFEDHHATRSTQGRVAVLLPFAADQLERRVQLGALGSLLGHFALERSPLLVLNPHQARVLTMGEHGAEIDLAPLVSTDSERVLAAAGVLASDRSNGCDLAGLLDVARRL